MTIKSRIYENLARFHDALEREQSFPTSSEIFDNLLQKEKLELMLQRISAENTPAIQAVDLILNMIRSVQFNHHPQTDVERTFFEIFNKEVVNELEEAYFAELKTEPASRIYIHFSGTGMPMFARNCANEYLIDDLQFNKQQPGLTYRVAGVASSDNGLWDPDSHLPDGKLCYRNEQRKSKKSQILKIKEGQGVCRAILDAYHFILNLARQELVAENVEIRVFGHSRGAVEGLILPHLLNGHEATKHYRITLCLNDPVPGGEMEKKELIQDEHLGELQEVLNGSEADLDEMMYSLPQNVSMALIFIARSEMRPDFAPINVGKIDCSNVGQLEVLQAAGYHNSTVFGNHSVDYHKYSRFVQFHLRRAGLDDDHRAPLVREFYIEKTQQFLGFGSEESGLNMLRAYGEWIRSFVDRPLMNPGYNVLQSDHFRDNHMLQASVPELFWDKHHEFLFRHEWPALYLLISEKRIEDRQQTLLEIEALIDNHKQACFNYLLESCIPEAWKWRIHNMEDLVKYVANHPAPAHTAQFFQSNNNPYFSEKEIVKQKNVGTQDMCQYIFAPGTRKNLLSERRPDSVNHRFQMPKISSETLGKILIVAGVAALAAAAFCPVLGMTLAISFFAAAVIALKYQGSPEHQGNQEQAESLILTF